MLSAIGFCYIRASCFLFELIFSSAPIPIGIVPMCIMRYSYFPFFFLGGLWPLTIQAAQVVPSCYYLMECLGKEWSDSKQVILTKIFRAKVNIKIPWAVLNRQ